MKKLVFSLALVTMFVSNVFSKDSLVLTEGLIDLGLTKCKADHVDPKLSELCQRLESFFEEELKAQLGDANVDRLNLSNDVKRNLLSLYIQAAPSIDKDEMMKAVKNVMTAEPSVSSDNL